MCGDAHHPRRHWRQAHDVDGWADDNGPTDVDKLTRACPPDTRLVEEGGWTTRKLTDAGR